MSDDVENLDKVEFLSELLLRGSQDILDTAVCMIQFYSYERDKILKSFFKCLLSKELNKL